MHGKHQQLIVKDRNVDQTLLELGLGGLLKRGKSWLAVLFCILEDSVNDIILVTHLDCFEISLLIAHFAENVRLKVAIKDEDGAASDRFESLLECLDYLLH